MCDENADCIGMQKIDDETLRPLHQEIIQEMGINKWFYSFKCSECKKDLTSDAIRSIGLKLNAKDIGNFSIDIHCRSCNANYELTAIKKCKSMMDFIHILSSCENPFVEGIFIEDYKRPPAENNLVEKYVERINKI